MLSYSSSLKFTVLTSRLLLSLLSDLFPSCLTFLYAHPFCPIQGRRQRIRGPAENDFFSCSIARAKRIQIVTLHRKHCSHLQSDLRFVLKGLLCKSTNNNINTKNKNVCKTVGARAASPVILYRLPVPFLSTALMPHTSPISSFI